MPTTQAGAADRGAVLVEFGLLLPVLAGLLLGIVTSGLAFFAKLEMATAAQEGARALRLGSDAAAAGELAESAAAGTASVTTADGTAVASTWTCAANSGDVAIVAMSRDMTIRFLIANLDVTVPARAVVKCA